MSCVSSFRAIPSLLVFSLLMASPLHAVGGSISQSLDRQRSEISFDVSSKLFRAAGHFDDYVAKISLAPGGLAITSISFRININSVVFETLPPQELFLLKGLLASIRNPLLEFQSSKITKLEANNVNIEGTAVFEGHKHPLRLTARMTESSSTRSRFSGSFGSEAFNLSTMPVIEQTCGALSGKARFDLVFRGVS